MKFLPCLIFFAPAACLLAQAPPKPATPAYVPEVHMSAENPPEPKYVDVPPDRVVVAVGDVKITAEQFNQIIDSLNAQYRAIARGAGRKRFAENLARILSLAQEARRRKMDEAPAFKIQAQFAGDTTLASLLYEDVDKNLKLDEIELRKYYEDHKAEYLQVHARHILIRAQGSPAAVKPGQKDLSDAEALARAQEIRKRLLAGEDFATVAAAESDDNSAANGGDLGFFGRGQMVPSFEEVAFSLGPGKLSEPLKTQFGYHLIRVEAVQYKNFEDVRPAIEAHLRPERLQKAVDEIQKKTPVVLDPDFFGMK
jgi:parvulin-like peptidyl-prolyl isomerase